MAPALTEAAGQTQKLKLKLPFAPPTPIPSHRLIAPTRTYRRNNKKDLVVLDENDVDADTLEKLLQACPVADIEFDVDEKGRNGDVSSKTKETTPPTTDAARNEGLTSISSPPSPSCTQCKPTMNGGLIVIDDDEEKEEDQRRRRRAEQMADDVDRNSLMNPLKKTMNNNSSTSKSSDYLSLPQWAGSSKTTPSSSANEELARASRALAEKTTARERFQEKLERRARRLVRRMCRLRVTQSSQHVSRQLLEFVAHQTGGGSVQSLNTSSAIYKQKHPLLDALLMRGPADLSRSPDTTRHDIDVGSLLRRLESSHNEKVSRTRLSATRLLSTTMAQPSTSMPDTLDVNTCDDMEWTSGSLLTDINYLDREVDSDATASSSGGESYDELEDHDERRTKSTSIHKRAFWKWAVDRAAVVSRWTWLQAQVSDLEYRIRQTSEIHRQIRRLKDGPSTSAAIASTFARDKSSASQVNGFVSKGSGSGGGGDGGNCSRTRCPTKPPMKRLLVRTVPTTSTLGGRQPLMTRRACRPLTVRCACAASQSQSSSTSTSSPFPAHSCVLCASRGSPGVAVPDCTMSRNERVALLDPSYHSVLSFPRDTSLAIHLDELLKSSDHGKINSKAKAVGGVKKKPRPLQINDHARKQCRKLKKNATVTLTARLRKMSKGRPVSGRKSSETSGSHRRLRKRPKRSSSTKRRNGSESSVYSSQNGTPVPSPELGDNSSSQASANSGWGMVMSTESRRGSAGSIGVLEMLRRKRGESEYDIDNIVIPYSMAASTRVERLQYKEILTPKWRVVPEYDACADPIGTADAKLNHDGDVDTVTEQQHHRLDEQQQEHADEGAITDVDDQKEDVSDGTVVQRHDRCELTEKKRFLGFMKNSKPGGAVVGGAVKGPATSSPVAGVAGANANLLVAARRTRSMRSDSRADSSGANTPDPLSPPPSIVMDHDATTLSSLAPPLNPFNNNNHHHHLHHHHHHGQHHQQSNNDVDDSKLEQPSMLHERRRTTSLSKRDRMLDDIRVCTPTAEVPLFSEPYVPVAPWEPRTFPLRHTDYDDMVQESKVVHTCENASHFTRVAAAASSSATNFGIPESDWNGAGGVTMNEPSNLNSNHCGQLDYAESAYGEPQQQQQQDDFAVK